ncbi:MAG: hypothetical protein R3F20_13965 [Planctomycetota bacterium]
MNGRVLIALLVGLLVGIAIGSLFARGEAENEDREHLGDPRRRGDDFLDSDPGPRDADLVFYEINVRVLDAIEHGTGDAERLNNALDDVRHGLALASRGVSGVARSIGSDRLDVSRRIFGIWRQRVEATGEWEELDVVAWALSDEELSVQLSVQALELAQQYSVVEAVGRAGQILMVRELSPRREAAVECLKWFGVERVGDELRADGRFTEEQIKAVMTNLAE